MMELTVDIADKAPAKRKEVEYSDSGKDSAPGVSFCDYPKPLAKFEDVVADPELFKGTLMKLHAQMRTKFMVPIIGGKSLDLHRLFNEVTSRGGIEKVLADRKWKDVTSAFSFPSTATNASYILRKYYLSLLRHYEQIYLFGAQGWNPNDTSSPFLETPAAQQKRRKDSAYPSVVGVIDGKFENGYFVTVAVGSEKLKGVLYHTPEQMADDSNLRTPYRRCPRQRKLKLLYPNHPKPTRSGYNFFFAEQHAQLKPLYPGGDKEIGRIIGVRWNALNEAEKAVYQERGLEDKERYKREMAAYNESLKMVQLASYPSPTYPSVVGVIDGKFENGYFVTVAVGSEKLKGVLYHAPEQMADDSNLRTPYRRRRRQRKLNLLYPNHLKPMISLILVAVLAVLLALLFLLMILFSE